MGASLFARRTPASRIQLARTPITSTCFMKIVYQILGFIFLSLGIVGIFVPGMPTTVFVLLASWCWARGSERFYRWLMNHPRFGTIVRDWQDRRAIPRRAKFLAISMMTASSTFLFFVMPSAYIWIAYSMAVICLLTAVWMLHLPSS